MSKSDASNSKKAVFNLIYILLVAVFLILIELLLRLVNFGVNTDPFITVPSLKNSYILNKYYLNKYYPFSQNIMFSSREAVIRKIKEEGVSRGFVLGGSTADGWPFESNQSWSKILERNINYQYKKNKVEIINLGISAMSSYYVRDMAKKLIKYQPDFIIIYAGHNEYYGTVSATTGKNRFLKILYLDFKEFKLFQLVQRLISPYRKSSSTLMAQQFAKNRNIPQDEKFDAKVTEDFIRNMDDTISIFQKKNIPVMIVEPISNLIDMPPFSSERESVIRNDIAVCEKAISEKNALNYQKQMTKIRSENTRSDALVEYIEGLYQYKMNQQIQLNHFILAKDLDSVPFRARTVLTESLKKYADLRDSGVYYILLKNLIEIKYGPDYFSKKIFIDHLHFNLQGQAILAKEVAYDLFKIIDPENNVQPDNDFNDLEKIKERVYLSDYNYSKINHEVTNILKNPPYSTMVIPFQYNEIPLSNQDRDYLKCFQSNDPDITFKSLIDFYRSRNNQNEIYRLLIGTYMNQPGEPGINYFMSQYYEQSGNLDQAEKFFKMAYHLTGDSRAAYRELQEFYKRNHISEKESK
jgi:lysophospholipase L1-like esterase